MRSTPIFAASRALFPVTETTAFLNNAAESPLNTRVRERLEDYLDLAARAPHRRPSVRGEVKTLLARLLGGSPEEYALVPSTGVGLGIAAAGFPWQAGDNVVLPAEEHWNNTFPWLALRERGVEARIVPLEPDGRLDLDAVAARMDSRTRVLALAAVRHSSGYRARLGELAELARSRGALFVVDGIQAAGALPLNVDREGIDVLAAAGFKWLLGLPGTGFLYVRRACWDRIRPVLPGMFAAEDELRELRLHPDARRYETGTIAYAQFHAWTAGLETLLEFGVEAIAARNRALTARLLEGLRRRGIEILSPVEREEEGSAILSFSLGSAERNALAVTRLEAAGIIVSLRAGRCRVSPNFYNLEAEIDAFLEALPRGS